MVEQKDIVELLSFVLTTEKQSYRSNPVPNSKETSEKETSYKKKIEEIAQKIAKREGIEYEN